MPSSPTTLGRSDARASVFDRVAFLVVERVGTQDIRNYAAQWLAYALPCRRFACTLADADARLGAVVGHYSFNMADFHRLLLASLWRTDNHAGGGSIQIVGAHSTSARRNPGAITLERGAVLAQIS